MSLVTKEISEIKAQKSVEPLEVELEVVPIEPKEPFIDTTVGTQLLIVKNAPKVTFHKPITSLYLMI